MIAFIVRAVPSTRKASVSDANTTPPYFGEERADEAGILLKFIRVDDVVASDVEDSHKPAPTPREAA